MCIASSLMVKPSFALIIHYHQSGFLVLSHVEFWNDFILRQFMKIAVNRRQKKSSECEFPMPFPSIATAIAYNSRRSYGEMLCTNQSPAIKRRRNEKEKRESIPCIHMIAPHRQFLHSKQEKKRENKRKHRKEMRMFRWHWLNFTLAAQSI